MDRPMTVGSLIEMLSDLDQDAEVRFMSQPNWPFEYSIAGLVTSEELAEPGEDESEGFTPNGRNWERTPTGEPVVYLVEGTQLGYGTRDAWDRCVSSY